MSKWSNLAGTVLGYLCLGIGGVRLKDSSGNLIVRNAGDTADAVVVPQSLGTGTRDGLKFLRDDGTWQSAASSVLQSEVTYSGITGQGSTNTAITRFTTVIEEIGTDITRTASATLGDSFTVNTAGNYAISFTSSYTTIVTFGISLNSTQLSTTVQSITAANRLAYVTIAAANYADTCSWSGWLEEGDVIRAHSATSATASASGQKFTMTRLTGNIVTIPNGSSLTQIANNSAAAPAGNAETLAWNLALNYVSIYTNTSWGKFRPADDLFQITNSAASQPSDQLPRLVWNIATNSVYINKRDNWLPFEDTYSPKVNNLLASIKPNGLNLTTLVQGGVAISAVGTATAIAIATDTFFASLRYANASLASIRQASAYIRQFTNSRTIWQFCPDRGSQRFFCGLSGTTTALTAITANAYLNCLGITGGDATVGTNIRVVHNDGAGVVTSIDTGIAESDYVFFFNPTRYLRVIIDFEYNVPDNRMEATVTVQGLDSSLRDPGVTYTSPRIITNLPEVAVCPQLRIDSVAGLAVNADIIFGGLFVERIN